MKPNWLAKAIITLYVTFSIICYVVGIVLAIGIAVLIFLTLLKLLLHVH